MAELYDRSVIVKVYPATGQAKKIEGLRVKFKVTKTSESNPNTAELDIYNLSETTRSLFQAKDSRVELQVGYKGIPATGIISQFGIGAQGNVETVFIGNVSKAVPKNDKSFSDSKKQKHRFSQSVIQGVDIVTKVQLADGANRYRNARLTKGFPPNITLDQVLDELTSNLGFAKGDRQGVPERRYANGLTVSGLVRDHLNVLMKGNELEWSIQDETLQVIPKNGATSETEILLKPTTGLVGSPQKTDKGLEFTSLLQPQLRPGRRVQIESAFVKGVFVVKKVTHDGDSHEGSFLSKCEASNA